MGGRVQLEMDFEPGLTEQFPDILDCLAAVVYGSRAGLNGCAAACDVSPSHLSRVLSRKDPDDVRHFSIRWLAPIIQITGDKRPISWFIEALMDDPQQRANKTLDEFAALAGRLNELLPHVEAAIGKRSTTDQG